MTSRLFDDIKATDWFPFARYAAILPSHQHRDMFSRRVLHSTLGPAEVSRMMPEVR